MWNLNNMKDSPKTTFLGVIMILAGIVLVFKKDGIEEFATMLIIIGGGMMGLKDPRVPPAAGGVSILLLFIMSSCVTYQKCYDKFGVLGKDSIKVPVTIYIDKLVPTLPDSLKGAINADSLLQLIAQMKAHKGKSDSLLIVNANSKQQLKLWYDKYTNDIKYRSYVPPDTIRIRDTVRQLVSCPPGVVFDPHKKLTWYEKLWYNYQLFAAWALLAGFIVLIVYTRLRH